ncbi:MAG: nitroreductase/quinone reductase family protein [Candidatus Rokuibacteriota bacterium]
MSRDRHWLATLVLLAVVAPGVACGGADRPEVLGPRGDTPGRRLPWPEATTPVGDWSFAAGEQEVALETRSRRGRSSVTVWSVVVGGKLYVATDDGRERKRWVTQIERDPEARIGIRERTYPVRARSVRAPEEWDAVMQAFGKKYGSQIAKYDFPRAGDTSRGRVFELAPRSRS